MENLFCSRTTNFKGISKLITKKLIDNYFDTFQSSKTCKDWKQTIIFHAYDKDLQHMTALNFSRSLIVSIHASELHFKKIQVKNLFLFILNFIRFF